jgi:hypothetical protein
VSYGARYEVDELGVRILELDKQLRAVDVLMFDGGVPNLCEIGALQQD